MSEKEGGDIYRGRERWGGMSRMRGVYISSPKVTHCSQRKGKPLSLSVSISPCLPFFIVSLQERERERESFIVRCIWQRERGGEEGGLCWEERFIERISGPEIFKQFSNNIYFHV